MSHRRILDDATDEQIREFASCFISMLKERDFGIYREAESWLYRQVYGCHFCEWLLNDALKHMVNEDGTVGGHWTLDQTTSVAKAKGIRFDEFNEFDWCYVMNMLYSDYYGAVPDSTDTYASMARAFLMDKDAPKGKAMLYHDAMCQR